MSPLTSPLTSIADAQDRLFAMARAVEPETLSLRAAHGRWTSEDIRARRFQPAADLSAMDGYAIRFADMPGPWRVIGESAAGRPFAGSTGVGEAIRIFTGAAMPDGADAVVIQEDVERDVEALHLTGDGPSRAGQNIRPRGLDFALGDPLVRRGARLTPARIAVVATGGHATLSVNRHIRVAIAATGDELVPPGHGADGLALPESNGVMLAALLADLPVDIIDMGILPDRLDTLRDAFASVRADLLITTGGASVGDHDLVRPAILAAGGQIDFWRIALRPGKPMMAGRLGDMMMLGLPGNPVSAFVTGMLFVRPLIAHMGGASDPRPRTARLLLGEDLPANQHRTDYMRAAIRDGRAYASVIQDSSMLLTLARSDCLVIREPHAPPARAGDSAEVLLIP